MVFLPKKNSCNNVPCAERESFRCRNEAWFSNTEGRCSERKVVGDWRRKATSVAMILEGPKVGNAWASNGREDLRLAGLVTVL